MTTNDMSPSMRKSIEYVLDGINKEKDYSSVANITMTFTNKDYTELKVYLSREIKTLTIHQDYVKNYSDKIIGELELGYDEYKTLVDLRKNLNCKIEITYLRPDHALTEVTDGGGDSKKPNITLKCKAVLLHYEDIYKKIPPERLDPKKRDEADKDRPTLHMTVEFIDEKLYLARKTQLNAVFRSTTMEKTLLYVCNQFGFNEAHIHDPDNKKTYTNFVIPPTFTIDNIISYLQNAPSMGIYRNGIISYISQNCWYIYPRYGEPLNKMPVHVYSIGSTPAYNALNRFDRIDDKCPKTRHIITNSGIEEENYSVAGTENLPTAYNVHLDENILEGCRRLVADGEFKANMMVKDYTSVPSDPVSMSDFIKVEYRHSYDNDFAIFSDLQAMQGTRYRFKWQKARPFCFRPATIVLIHADDPVNGYKTMKGMCEGADYFFKRDTSSALMPFFTCNADIVVECKNIIGGQRNNL